MELKGLKAAVLMADNPTPADGSAASAVPGPSPGLVQERAQPPACPPRVILSYALSPCSGVSSLDSRRNV